MLVNECTVGMYNMFTPIPFQTMKKTYNAPFVAICLRIRTSSTHTSVARTASHSNAPFATKASPDKRYCDNIWCYIKEPRDLDSNVITVEERSDIVAI